MYVYMLGGLLLAYRKGAALLRRISLLRRPHKHIGLYYHTCLLPPQEFQGLLGLDAKATLKKTYLWAATPPSYSTQHQKEAGAEWLHAVRDGA